MILGLSIAGGGQEYRKVPDIYDERVEEQNALEGPLYTFHNRPPWALEEAQTLQSKKDVLRLLQDKVVFGIGSSVLDCTTNLGPATLVWDGYTL
jgi:hypothetical protein